MVGKKGCKNTAIQVEKISKSECDNVENSEFILDLDELHINVTPPSELNENYSPKTEGKNSNINIFVEIFSLTNFEIKF